MAAARAVPDGTFSDYGLQGSNFGPGASTEEPWMVNEQQVTIFHRGRACSFDLVELQARSMIVLAAGQATNISWKCDSSPSLQSTHLHRHGQTSSELSVKRSLQKFLQQRKRRSRANSPNKHKL